MKNAAIVFLAASDRITHWRFLNSLEILKSSFLCRYPYPVRVFHEDSYPDENKKIIKSIYSKTDFQLVEFKPPDDISPDALTFNDDPEKRGLGYRNMCRFFHTGLFNYISDLDWYWRLDTDSYLMNNLRFDPFQFLDNGGFDYGYATETNENPDFVVGLLDFVKDYVKRKEINNILLEKIIDENGKYTMRQVYNNFEIMRVGFWERPDVQDFVNEVDKTGNIYRCRWGDAPLRTYALALFSAKAKIYNFLYEIDYCHYPHIQRNGRILSMYTNFKDIMHDDWLGITGKKNIFRFVKKEEL